MKLNSEKNLILLLSRLFPSEGDIQCVRKLLNAGTATVDYGKLVDMAVRHGVAPLLYKNLNGVNMVPDSMLSRLRQAYLQSVADNLRKAKEIVNLLGLLKRIGVDAIPLKGVFASEFIFESAGLYDGSDIDILVRPSMLQAVKEVLLESGYRFDEKTEHDMLSSHYHFVFENERQLVEVHWNLVKRYFDVPPEFWWEGAYVASYDGHDILCLAPDKYLLCTIFRLFSHMFRPLKFFVLVSEITNKYYENIDWHGFFHIANKYRMGKLAVFTLRLSNELLGTKVPDEIIGKNIKGYRHFRRSIVKGLFGHTKRPYAAKLLYVFILDSPIHVLAHFAGRLWPGEGELRLRYGIREDSRIVYIYYLLNPLLLPLMVMRKRSGPILGN